MITKPKHIADMFSCLHDGRIVRATAEDGRLRLEVQIQYLAERVDPRYRSFTVHLDDVTDLEFSTWPNDPNCGAIVITDPSRIFAPCLEILEGSTIDGKLQVTCNQPSSAYDYCGGEIRARVGSAKITRRGWQSILIGAARSSLGGVLGRLVQEDELTMVPAYAARCEGLHS